MPGAAAQERGPGPVDQAGQLRGFRRHRERAGVDAPRIEKVADEAAHVIGLLDDDAGELAHLGRVERRRFLQQRNRRALDGGERLAQLVAYHAEELRPHPFDLVERRQVLHGHHHRADPGPLGANRRDVDQRPDAAPVRDREHHLLGAHRLGAHQMPGQRKLAKRDLAPVRAPARDHPQQLLRGMARHVKRLSILTPDRRAKLTPLSGTAEVVPVANRGDPRGFV